MSRDSNRAIEAFTAARYFVTALLIAGIFCASASAASLAQKKQAALTQFENAERMREALNGRPAAERSVRDYKRVIEAYRRVYHIAPTSVKAAESVADVAELLVELGHATKNPNTLKEAIGQYEFLRREYPGSKYRLEALFTIAQIYKDDLNDNENAGATFEEYLKRYPHSQLAADAKAALKEIDEETARAAKATEESEKEKPKPVAKAEAPTTDEAKKEDDESAPKTSLVTGVRHWSTPDYTRIAIDLEQDVTYDSGRIPNPDRIYFDLKGTRLSSVLKGKSFDVDDGYLKKIRVGQFAPGMTRIVLEVGDDVNDYTAFLLPNPSRLIIDIHGKKPATLMARTKQPQAVVEKDSTEKPAETASEKSKPATTAQASGKETVAKPTDPKESPSNAQKESSKPETESAKKSGVPVKIVEPEPEKAKPVTVAKATPPEPPVKDDPPIRVRGKKRQAPEKLNVHTAQPTSDGERSLIRALGLKIGRIVIDAGHGGHDTGTIGPNGLLEKDLVLDVALRLGKLLEDRLGASVVYTRDDDTFIPLETRTAIANREQADLFISIHANSSRDKSARGVETYYLNFTSSRDALEVAARENAVSETSIHQLQDLVKKIALKEKIEESREFALDVQQSLHDGLAAKAPAIRDRGVKKAPFIVLIGANMPSILAEISFISNPTDEKKLKTPVYRQKIADSLYRGVAKYVNGLSGVKVAQKLPKEEGQ